MPGFSQLALSLLAGSLTTLSPCVLPLLPLILAGVVQRNPWGPVQMALGMVGMFALLGAVLGGVGAALAPDPEQIRMFGAALLALSGLALLWPALGQRLAGLLQPLAARADGWAAGVDGSRAGGAVALGALLGMVWSPCSGPMLGSILALVASEGGGLAGFVLLSIFGLGAALPLVAVAYLSRAGMLRFRAGLLTRMPGLKRGLGALLLLAGLAILGGGDRWLETAWVNLLPERWLGWIGRY
ncbi:MAG: hypothetical protein RIR00_348 [Pseudomonadota bacterium]|jgi:cytochrome c biogenesis protein CcdA